MFVKKDRLARLLQVGVEINQIADLDLLLEKVLSEARKLLDADAGSIYIKEDDKLKFSHAQNETLRKKLGPDKKLIYTTFSMPINNKSIAGFVANNGVTLNIKDAYKISDTLSYSFDGSYDKLSGYHTQSMLTIPMKNSRAEIIGVLQLINKHDDKGNIISFLKEDEPIVRHFAIYAANAIERAQMTRTTIMRMISMAELRDPKETGAHVNRVAAYAVEIYEAYAKKKKIPQDKIDVQRDSLRMAAMLHDVGKVAISDLILKKPAKLTDEEFKVMQHHTIIGAQLFIDARSDFDEQSAEVALNHHEKWDGSGYPGYVDFVTEKSLPGHTNKEGLPLGKKGKEIPLLGRIVAIADVYDALCSKRVYKEAWDKEKALQIIREESGKHFDPELVEIFFDILDVINSVSERYPDEELE
jgi:HD-GYP domain-containing protein (c-di-GMP phosphodiesterase class II)